MERNRVSTNTGETKIPWTEAKAFAERFDLDQVITWTWASGLQHVVTYGKSIRDSDQAAQGGNHLKRALLNWPASEACAMPDRVLRIKGVLEAYARDKKSSDGGQLAAAILKEVFE